MKTQILEAEHLPHQEQQARPKMITLTKPIKKHIDDAYKSVVGLISLAFCILLTSCNPTQMVMFNADGTPKGLVQGGGVLSKAKNVAMKFKKGDVEVTTVIGSAETDGTVSTIASGYIVGQTARITGAQKVVDNANKRPSTTIPGTTNTTTLPDGTVQTVQTPATIVPPPPAILPPH